MKIFVVSYDLRNAETSDYQALYEALEIMGGIEVLESTWTLRLSNIWTARSVRDILLSKMDRDDGIYVAEITRFAHKNCDHTPHQFLI